MSHVPAPDGSVASCRKAIDLSKKLKLEKSKVSKILEDYKKELHSWLCFDDIFT